MCETMNKFLSENYMEPQKILLNVKDEEKADELDFLKYDTP